MLFSEPRYCWIFTLWQIRNVCCKDLPINICPSVSVLCAHVTMKYDCFHVYMQMLYTDLSCGRCIFLLCFCMDGHSCDKPIACGLIDPQHSARLNVCMWSITAQKCARTSMLIVSAFSEMHECWSSFSPKSSSAASEGSTPLGTREFHHPVVWR